MLVKNKKSVVTTTSTTDNHSNFKYKISQILKNCK